VVARKFADMSRLDSIVYKMGFAASRNQARQLVRHNHFLVNDIKVNIPSYSVKQGDSVAVKESSRNIQEITDSIAKSEHRGLPAWVEVDTASLTGKVLHIPSRDEMQLPVQEQLIIELYSK